MKINGCYSYERITPQKCCQSFELENYCDSDNGFVAFFITGELRLAVEVGLAYTIVKLVVYYAHERTRASISYGEIKPPEYTI